jgi:dolichol-phosphate mannosyltransferase
VTLHEVCLHDAEAVSSLTGSIRADWIFHLAAHGAYSWQTDWEQMVRTNLQGTMSLVSGALQTGFEAFVNAGSSSEYGFKDHAPAETEMLEPNSNYAVTKAAATLYCRHMAQTHRVHLPTLRLYSVFGPYEEPRRLFPQLIAHGLKQQWPPLADPDAARDFVYVDDVVEAFLRAAQTRTDEWGPIYNVGTGIQTSIGDVAATARKILEIGTEPVWNTMPKRAWDANTWVSDNRKIRTQIGWKPRVNLEEGFRLMVEWYRSGHDSVRSGT